MSVSQLAALVVLDIVIVAGISIGFGALAPRLSSRLFRADIPPLTLTPWETPGFYRFLHVSRLARRLPELGATFGGESKNVMPERNVESIDRYLVEVRRAEWVHWVSLVSWVPLAFFNPWPLTLLFALIVIVGNKPFLLILRSNRQRLTALKTRLQS